MPCLNLLLPLLAFVAAAAQLAAAAKLSSYDIELAADASKEERYAASVIQVWASAVAGSSLKIVTTAPDGPSERSAKRNVIAVGYRAVVQRNASASEELRGLGLEGWLISGGRDGSWAVSGDKGAPRGTIYGAHAFAETVLGVRFLAPNVTLSPKNGTDPSMDGASMHKAFVPPFEVRPQAGSGSQRQPATLTTRHCSLLC
jgi:hypothetical protein|eukprot:COSAG06_NODE_3976_length_4696_cov_4.916371_1_plen_201_part_00